MLLLDPNLPRKHVLFSVSPNLGSQLPALWLLFVSKEKTYTYFIKKDDYQGEEISSLEQKRRGLHVT